ncbi:MAG TPA: hypothetical protein DCZ01_06145 [Elusimicrobia bacterium]|nr:MAG: hypothetical protein A2X37_10905 [Elusimicrobia bacterium GWA2_66_18]OGR71040.1 MAG: hypothetical protein A2X40_11055 [Elusimicrobia bacterium GWC2_65_9]HAZ08095.1 hypothetical protein [Elusimicrobiota bacterium]
MSRASLLAAVLLTGCAGPRPCTRTLCPARLAGSYEVRGWSGTLTIAPDMPQPPVPSDSEVSVRTGEAEFTHGQATLKASAGTAFRFMVSTRSVASLEVSSGCVTVLVSSMTAPASVLPGALYLLPAANQ